MPGVSTKTICALSRFSTPSMEVRVVCGLSETIASFPPIKAFNNVDLPAFGRPRMETKPERRPSVGDCPELDALMDGLETTSHARPSTREPVPLSAHRRPVPRFECHPFPLSRRRAARAPAIQ